VASIFVRTQPPTDIDYSLNDGRVRSFELRGEKLFDEHDGTNVEGWEEKLVEFVIEQGLNIDTDGRGLHAFVYRMIDDGLITPQDAR